MTNAQALTFHDQGFEVGLHPQNNCTNYVSYQGLADTYTSQLGTWRAKYHPPLADHQPLPLHRLERLGLAAEGRARLGDPARHQLLLLPRIVDRRPPGLHDRVRHADAVRRHRRLDDRRLPGQHR